MKKCIAKVMLTFALVLNAGLAGAITANKVDFEFHPKFFRVIVHYTLPPLKEFRVATADFRKKKEAEAFYWHLVRGAEFYLGDPKNTPFLANPKKPDPW